MKERGIMTVVQALGMVLSCVTPPPPDYFLRHFTEALPSEPAIPTPGKSDTIDPNYPPMGSDQA